jgi:hypothetical protein
VGGAVEEVGQVESRNGPSAGLPTFLFSLFLLYFLFSFLLFSNLGFKFEFMSLVFILGLNVYILITV